jgi:hypothetical protein
MACRIRGFRGTRCVGTDDPWRHSSTAVGVAVAPIRGFTRFLTPCIACISPNASAMDASGCKTRSIDGLSEVCEPTLRDSISEESDGVYEGLYRSRKYLGGLMSDGIGPIA